MKIGITTDIVDSTKYHKGVSYYIQYLVKNLAKICRDGIFLIHFKQSTNDIYNLGLNEIILGNGNFDISKLLVNYCKVNELKDLDIIHITAPRIPYLPLLSAPTKIVLTVHGLDLYIPEQWRAKFYREPIAWVQQKVLSSTFSKYKDEVEFIAVSNFLKQELITHLQVPKERVHVVYHGVDPKFRPLNLNKKYLIISDTPLPELIEIYYKLREFGVHHKMVIFGKRGYGIEAKRLVNKLKLQKYVKFAGHLPYD